MAPWLRDPWLGRAENQTRRRGALGAKILENMLLSGVGGATIIRICNIHGYMTRRG